MAEKRVQHPRFARTEEEERTELPSWYNTRLHTPAVEVVRRVAPSGFVGEGTFGQVFKGIDLDSGCFVAVKKIKLPPKHGFLPSKEEELLRREVKILSNVSHKNIVEFLGSSGWGSSAVHIFLSLKTGNICDLLEKFRSNHLNEALLSQLLHNMLEALDYLAFRGWIHRDVKPQNILYTPDDGGYRFQLADFGLAHQEQFAQTQCGSPLYMAPEIINRTHPQSSKIDVWSLFVVFGVVTQRGELDDPQLAHHGEVLCRVKIAAAQLRRLSPMAEEDPGRRASAAQMLVAHFGGQGLSTPRARVHPIPDPGSAAAPSRASEQLHSPEPPKPSEQSRPSRPRALDPTMRTANAKVMKPGARGAMQPKYASPRPYTRQAPTRGHPSDGIDEIE
ncbi:predicted protein [Uncinocarpus reesii 1704]|uniref:non-specific serine/threonine protein kinase n=1 Tax=Uncinocarpus reesii (strain UAMH 1704) TaxID=336963 RepID=C4JRJ8_UNCRE|nr:uncharacterized protein UREG_05087 [Uncinocarpus reesii 1704]EEP80245.1 predicted protein [Uncinocarpus reesii 1704]